MVEAGDGEEAMQLYPRVRPDLVLLDLMLPGIDGLEVCRQVRAAPGTAGAKVAYKTRYDNFINGKFVAPVGGQYFDVVTPISGKVYTQAARSTEADIELALVQMRAATLARIDESLARLHAGKYGQCVDCHDEIEERRLRALPFASLCRDCQAEAESDVRAQREAKAFERLQKELVNVTLRAGTRD